MATNARRIHSFPCTKHFGSNLRQTHVNIRLSYAVTQFIAERLALRKGGTNARITW